MATRKLSIDQQGDFRYTIGPYAEPVLEIEPGETVAVETVDAFGGKITGDQDRPSEALEGSHLNPQSGPIYVNGAEKGDTFRVTIESIEPRGPQPRGTTCLVPYFGGLTATDRTAMLHDSLPEQVNMSDVTTDGIAWDDETTIPYDPFIGTIGTAPEIDSVSSVTPFKHGGNMDLPDVRPGNEIHLPVNTDGALLYLGDCHAAQGDGELCGVAVEIPTVTMITVDVIPDAPIEWPRIESDEFIMAVGSMRLMEDAARIAYRELIEWMVDEYGFETYDAYMFLSQVGSVRLGNMVDPNYTIGASVPKSYL
ncbi:acetamidase/formamidase family protein [Natronococcus sp. A-GB7]|uniref:acetamidase/formamidase family protein n=1 Tax=Natronococcus sp. A-GB7 TaxID=3037649 RepID=UPI00241E06B4|nr:acetamidase/formamidase family protein [Natronococcus sp. A-GB7]MDG5821401.1 acetamidase/formamidase family protein [Natronococcus sp. A-GB7]